MNGVKLYQNLLSWLITGSIFSILYVIPLIILFKNTFSTRVDPYLYYSNAFLFWILMTVHIVHLISFGMHIAAYFSKRKFLYFIVCEMTLYRIYMFYNDDNFCSCFCGYYFVNYIYCFIFSLWQFDARKIFLHYSIFWYNFTKHVIVQIIWGSKYIWNTMYVLNLIFLT